MNDTLLGRNRDDKIVIPRGEVVLEDGISRNCRTEKDRRYMEMNEVILV